MKKEEWDKVEKALSGYYGHASLKVDGRKITFQRQLVSKNRLGIVTFVDGEFKGIWCFGDKPSPETVYMRHHEKFKYTAGARREMKKFSKARLKALGYDPNEKRISITPFWPNVATIRRYYEKTFSDIRLLEADGVQG